MQPRAPRLRFLFGFGCFVAASCALVGCTSPTTIGSDLIDGDSVYGELVESGANTPADAEFRMNTTTEIEDSVITYRTITPRTFMNRFPFGNLTDPIFGKSTAAIYLHPYASAIAPPNDAIIDSMVLILQYDVAILGATGDSSITASRNEATVNAFKRSQILGDTIPFQTMHVYRLSEDIDNNIDPAYYSNKTFTTFATPLVSHTFAARPSTFVPVIGKNFKNTADSTLGLALPHLRIKLPNSFAQDLLADKTQLATNQSLRSLFKGLMLKPDVSNTAMMRFNLLSPRILPELQTFPTNSNTSFSCIITYYHTSTAPTTVQAYPITFAGADQSVAIGSSSIDRSGTPVATALIPANKNRIGDSVMYIQGLAGTNGRIDFPNLGKLKGKVIINKAELVLKAISDASNMPMPLYLGARQKNILGETIANKSLYNYIGDMYLYGTYTSYPNPFASFGGALKGSTYTMDVTNTIQDIIDGRISSFDKDLINKSIFISPINKAERPQRVILGGARNSIYAPTLRVYLTRL